jgi:hypothetical protein
MFLVNYRSLRRHYPDQVLRVEGRYPPLSPECRAPRLNNLFEYKTPMEACQYKNSFSKVAANPF